MTELLVLVLYKLNYTLINSCVMFGEYNQEVIPTSCNEPKERWSLVFSVCNQEYLLLKIVTNSRSLEKLFVRMEERKKVE